MLKICHSDYFSLFFFNEALTESICGHWFGPEFVNVVDSLLLSVFAWGNQPGSHNVIVVKWERSQDGRFVMGDARGLRGYTRD